MDEGLHILVIDDDPELRELLCTILRPEGHHVFDVGSAEEGLELLPYTTFQVAFLDHNLPGMDGLVLGQYLRRNNPHLQIALVTGSEESLSKPARAHDIRVIAKPFDFSEILLVVREARESAQARLQAEAESAGSSEYPELAPYLEDLHAVYDVPGAPDRIVERLERAVRRSLNELRSDARFNERDRNLAYAGLVTMVTLGVDIPKGSSGERLTDEYDNLMRQHGRRPAFSEDPTSGAWDKADADRS